VRKALVYGAQSARLLGHQIDELKAPETTVRMRLSGNLAGSPVGSTPAIAAATF
jgi:hypothetical protein